MHQIYPLLKPSIIILIKSISKINNFTSSSESELTLREKNMRRLSLIIVLIHTASAIDCIDFVTSSNIDFWGDDIKVIRISRGQAECEEECRRLTECKAYSMTKRGSQKGFFQAIHQARDFLISHNFWPVVASDWQHWSQLSYEISVSSKWALEPILNQVRFCSKSTSVEP